MSTEAGTGDCSARPDFTDHSNRICVTPGAIQEEDTTFWQTFSLLAKLAFPQAIAQIVMVSSVVADVAFVGHLGTSELAAIGKISLWLHIYEVAIKSMSSATVILGSQAMFEADGRKGASQVFACSLLLGGQ